MNGAQEVVGRLLERGFTLENLSRIVCVPVERLERWMEPASREALDPEEEAFWMHIAMMLDVGLELVPPDERLISVTKLLVKGCGLRPSVIAQYANVDAKDVEIVAGARLGVDVLKLPAETKYKIAMVIMTMHYLFKWPDRDRNAQQQENQMKHIKRAEPSEGEDELIQIGRVYIGTDD